jgi:large subunit ribosomal protein L24
MAIAKRKPAEPVRIDFKKEDTVRVITGRDKGKTGRVLQVNRDTGRLLVEHVMMIKRHTRPNPARQIKGGIAERESPIQASNVLIVCPSCNKAVRIAHQVDHVAGGKTRRTRICRKCGQTLDKK